MSNDIKSTAISWSVVQSPTVQSNEISTNTITLNSVDGSSNTTISSEGIITPNLTTFSINNNDLTFNDTEIVIGDKILTFDGEDEIIPANSVTDEARVFARVAQESAVIAESSKTQAESSASAAATSAASAESSKTQAAESAAQAAESVDMAEWSLPCDFMRFSHVTNFPELAEQAPDLLETEVWRYPLNSLGNSVVAPMDNYFKKLKKVYLYSEIKDVWSAMSDPEYRIVGYFSSAQLEEIRCVYPNAETFYYMSPGGNARTEKLYIYAPKCRTISPYFAGGLKSKWVWAYLETSKIGGWDFGGESVRTIAYIGPNIKTIEQQYTRNLVDVLCSFPKATVINFQKAKLNKESVLRIVNNLLTYDSATMETVPELTMGIDPALNGDEEINAALLLAQAPVEEGGKGWSVAVSGFTINSDANAATLGLRKPIYIKRWEDSDGGYIDENGTRWSVRYGNSILHNWQANEQLGYEEFASLEDALTTWGLTEYIEVPNEEQINN